jgi:tetratricopeptide (TPR) repeat protein
MMRRDYLIRLIEAFGQELRRIESLKDEKKWDEAGFAVDAEVKRMTGKDTAEVVKLSETELLALLIAGETAQAVREKAWMLTMLLKQVGDVAAAQDRVAEADGYYFKALHLLLKVLHGEDACEFPEFVPQVEALVEAIGRPALPVETEALLMEHYESTGQFDRAENALHAILQAEPHDPDVRQFGLDFYERIKQQSDERLAAGNLPRAEVESGLAEWRTR